MTAGKGRRSATRRGFFVVLDGPDGCGKTTQARRLARRWRRERGEAVLVREPGGTALGERLRRTLLDPRLRIVPEAEALLFFAARVQLVEERLRSALRRGAAVVADRYTPSTAAYQGHARGLGIPRVLEIDRRLRGRLVPDLVVLLDLDAAAALRRRSRRRDRFESRGPAFARRVRAGFRAFRRVAPGRIALVDASGSRREVEARIWREVARAVR